MSRRYVHASHQEKIALESWVTTYAPQIFSALCLTPNFNEQGHPYRLLSFAFEIPIIDQDEKWTLKSERESHVFFLSLLWWMTPNLVIFLHQFTAIWQTGHRRSIVAVESLANEASQVPAWKMSELKPRNFGWPKNC